jgi:uncharacterized caspase-like protein
MSADYDAALVIGIAHYPWLRSLEGPIRDANRFADWLRGPGRLPASNVKTVISDEATHGRPILDEIDAAFDCIFAQAEDWEAPRRLYIYFAGHGCSKEIDHVALLMANATETRIERAMNATEYRKALAKYLFPEQVYFFDCCRNYDSVVTGRGPELTVNPEAGPVIGLTQFVMYAAGFTQYANERHLVYSERRGLFTEALMEGLNGGAAMIDPLTREGVVTTDLLIPYVKDRLHELARQENVRQQLWQGAPYNPRRLVLATGIDPWRRRLPVRLPPNTTRLVVQDQLGGMVVDRPVSGETVEQLDLEMTQYTVTAEPSDARATIRMLPGSPAELDLGGSRDA